MQKQNKMGVMPIGKLIITMSLPMMLSMLVQALYNVVDSVWVAKVSQDALTAVSLSFPVQNLMIAFATGTGVGMNALVSRCLGMKDNDRANSTAVHGLILSMITGLLFCLFGIFGVKFFFNTQISSDTATWQYGVNYLSIVCMLSFGCFGQIIVERMMQSTGKTNLSMISQLIGAVVNIILDPLLILGWGFFPRLEAKGAAIATIIGQFTAFVAALILNKKFNKEINVSLKGFKFNGKIVADIYKIGVPSIVMVAIGSVMNYYLNKILISFTETAVTVFGVYFKLQSFFFMPIFGMNNGVIPIVAYNYGARQKKRMISTIKLSSIFAVVIMAVGTAVMWIFPGQLLSMFDANEEMLAIGIPALRAISSSFVVAGVCISLGSIFQAVGKSYFSMIVSISRQLLVLLPVAAWLAKLGDVNKVWLSFPIAEVASFTVSIISFIIVYKTVIAKIEEPKAE